MMKKFILILFNCDLSNFVKIMNVKGKVFSLFFYGVDLKNIFLKKYKNGNINHHFNSKNYLNNLFLSIKINIYL